MPCDLKKNMKRSHLIQFCFQQFQLPNYGPEAGEPPDLTSESQQ